MPAVLDGSRPAKNYVCHLPRVLDEKVAKLRIPHSVRNCRLDTQSLEVSRLKALSREGDYLC